MMARRRNRPFWEETIDELEAWINRDREKEYWTYLIQAGDDGLVKVGHSADPQRRLAALQTGSGESLTIRATLRGANQEPLLHDIFAHLRRRGEWFDPAILVALGVGL